MCKIATRKPKAPLHLGLQLLLISSFVLTACGGAVQTNVLARMTKEKPRWLQDASAVCSENHRCAVAYHWHEELDLATARARAKAISTLVSEVAVTISGVLELEERVSESHSGRTEKTSISHRIAARVKGRLTKAKTKAHYWEQAERYTKDGPKPQYRSYVLVSVPTSVLDAMSTEALKAKKRLEVETLALSKRLALGDAISEEPIVLLRMLKGLKRRANDLTMRSVLTETLIVQIEAIIAAKTELSVLKTEITPEGRVQIILGLAIGGVIPVGCHYKIAIPETSEGNSKHIQVNVTSAGTVSLTYSPTLASKQNQLQIYPKGLQNASKSIELPSILSLGDLERRVVYSGYSKRYIGRLVAQENPSLGSFPSEAGPAEGTDKPKFLLELNVRLAPKPARVTPSLIQVQGRIVAQLFYLNGARVAVGPSRTNTVAGMGADELAAAKAVARAISDVTSSMTASVFGELTPRASIP